MKDKIRVIVADDHDIYLDGLERNLNGSEDIEVVALATNGKKLLELVHQYGADVVLTDISMPVMSGVEAISQIQKLEKNIKSIVLSNSDDRYFVIDALKAGAVGYLLKGGPKADVIQAIKTVHENTGYFYCNQTKKVMTDIIRENNFEPLPPPVHPEIFTNLERKIIHYICEEKTSKEIGDILCMGKRSIEKHRGLIFDKMGVKQFAGIIKYAIKNNLYPAPASILEQR